MSRKTWLAAGFGEAGQRLRARGGRRAEPVTRVTLTHVAAPALSLILDGGADAGRSLAAIAAAAGAIAAINAELVLADHGADPRNVHLAGRIENLRYFYDQRPALAPRRNMAASFCRGETLVFLRNSGRRFDLGLRELAALCAEGLIAVSPRIAGQAMRAWPELSSLLTPGPARPYLGLDLAIGRAAFEACGGFDEQLDDGDGFAAADLLIRAAAGRAATVWRETPAAEDNDRPADNFVPLG